MNGAFIVAIVGAESTGKSTLATALARRLSADGHDTVVVPEYLREFCERAHRTPRADEQAAIAAEQTRRIAAAAAVHPVVVADTTALMTAVYSDHVFGDRSLDAPAIAAHRAASLTLLTALDLPWQPDGLQRDGPQVRGPVDALVRAALRRGGIDFSLVFGAGEARVDAAMRSVHAAMALHRAPACGTDMTCGEPLTRAPWQWCCERCGDARQERRLLRGGALS